jgi:hypothetical protein
MAADWVRMCRVKDLAVDEPNIEVAFEKGRRHRVTVYDEGHSYKVRAFVTRRAVVESLQDLPIQVWVRNRATQLVGFRIDPQSRLVAEAWIPKPGLTAEEFQLYVRAVATESDRLEYALTGRDAE